MTTSEKTLKWWNDYLEQNKTYPLLADIEMQLNLAVDSEKKVNNLAIHGVSNTLPTDDYWEARCKLMEQVEENNPCDPDINQGQIDAWSKYHNFIKERGQR